MEKHTPHYKLVVVKALIAEGKIEATKAALAGGLALGLDYDEIVVVVKNLSRGDFYKSMTTHNDHKVWQDVYHPMTQVGEVYLKITVIEGVLVVSFKEL